MGLLLASAACTTSDDAVVSVAQPTKAFENPMLSNEAGLWRGDGVQRNGSNWPMSVRLGGKIATVEYPTLGCSSKWYKMLESASSSAYWEKIETGKGKCADGGIASLALQKSGNIVFLYSRTPSGPKEAVAVLERGSLDDVSRERLVRLTKDEALRDKEKDVAFEVPREVDNPEFVRLASQSAPKKTEPKPNQKQVSGDVAAAHLLYGLFNAVYGGAPAPSSTSSGGSKFPLCNIYGSDTCFETVREYDGGRKLEFRCTKGVGSYQASTLLRSISRCESGWESSGATACIGAPSRKSATEAANKLCHDGY